MDETKSNATQVLALDETHVLSSIVDAMLAAKSTLASANAEQWKEILVGSCRKMRDSDSPDTLCTAAC